MICLQLMQICLDIRIGIISALTPSYISFLFIHQSIDPYRTNAPKARKIYHTHLKHGNHAEYVCLSVRQADNACLVIRREARKCDWFDDESTRHFTATTCAAFYVTQNFDLISHGNKTSSPRYSSIGLTVLSIPKSSSEIFVTPTRHTNTR